MGLDGKKSFSHQARSCDFEMGENEEALTPT